MMVKTKGMTLTVTVDNDPPSAQDECFDIGHLLTWHRNYELGEKNPYRSPEDFYADEEMKDKIFVMLPVYMLDHSGLRFSTSPSLFRAVDPQGFDYGQVGVIYAAKADVLRLYGNLSEETKQIVTQSLIDEITAFDDYQTRQYYYYYIEDGEGEVVDTSGGYYGEGAADVLGAMRECAGSEYYPLFDKAMEKPGMELGG